MTNGQGDSSADLPVVPVPAPPPMSAQTRWRPGRRWLVRATLLVLLVLFHAPLFRLLAAPLVVEDPAEPVDAVIVIGGGYGEAPYDEIASLSRAGSAREVVFVADESSRLTQLGILPPAAAVARRELAARGISGTALTVLPGNYPTVWAASRSIREWMESHPESHAVVLSDEFGSRMTRHIVRRVLGPEAAARVRWRIIPDPRFGRSNWWRSRQGVVAVGGAYVSLVHTHLCGEPPKAEVWDPEVYEEKLKTVNIPR